MLGGFLFKQFIDCKDCPQSHFIFQPSLLYNSEAVMITCSRNAPRALEFYPSFKLGRLLNIIASTPAVLRARIRCDRNEVITFTKPRRILTSNFCHLARCEHRNERLQPRLIDIPKMSDNYKTIRVRRYLWDVREIHLRLTWPTPPDHSSDPGFYSVCS